MNKDYQSITSGITSHIGKLRQAVPEVMKGFSQMSRGATADGALSQKAKELIALALGVAAHCDGCIGFHAKALAQLGATREEVMEALGMAIYMGGGPSLMYAADAVDAFEQFSDATNAHAA